MLGTPAVPIGMVGPSWPPGNAETKPYLHQHFFNIDEIDFLMQINADARLHAFFRPNQVGPVRLLKNRHPKQRVLPINWEN